MSVARERLKDFLVVFEKKGEVGIYTVEKKHVKGVYGVSLIHKGIEAKDNLFIFSFALSKFVVVNVEVFLLFLIFFDVFEKLRI